MWVCCCRMIIAILKAMIGTPECNHKIKIYEYQSVMADTRVNEYDEQCNKSVVFKIFYS